MNAAMILTWSIHVAFAILVLTLLLTSIRVIIGPTAADRILALDQLVAAAIGFIALVAIRSGFSLYVDIALALGLVGFLATTAFARYLYVHGAPNEKQDSSAVNPLEIEGDNRS